MDWYTYCAKQPSSLRIETSNDRTWLQMHCIEVPPWGKSSDGAYARYLKTCSNHRPISLASEFHSLALHARKRMLTAYRARPIPLQILLRRELLAFRLLEWSSSNQYLKECDTEGPHVRLASVMWLASCTFGGQIFWCTVGEVAVESFL